MFSWVRRGDRDPASKSHQVTHLEPPAHLQHRAQSQRSDQKVLKMLSYNIQVGIQTKAYREYVTNGWKHVLPHLDRAKNLHSIAEVVRSYDVVGLQEVDAGSIRSGFVNQVEFLAHLGGFPYWYSQLNRDLGPLAQHGNGLLSRLEPLDIEDHKLPGAIPGRGAVFMRVPFAGDSLLIVMLHLSLGERSRRRQLEYVAQQIGDEKHVVVMGDMNTQAKALRENSPLSELCLQPADESTPTYPAWRPRMALDHVLVSPSLEVKGYAALDCQCSDHLPVAVEIAALDRQ